MAVTADDRVKHYSSAEELPTKSAKYFQQRYQFFSRYDEGILMTPEAFHEVTPEPVARMIARHISESMIDGKNTIIDCFAGVGGNTIAFAQAEGIERVFAVENDPAKIACLRHNLKIYGLEKKVMVSQGDVFQVLKRFKSLQKEAIVFGSPPWGGPGYADFEIFDLSTMKPYNLETLYNAMVKVAPQIVLYLPRTSSLPQLAALHKGNMKMEVTHYCLKGASKALCAYYGEWKDCAPKEGPEPQRNSETVEGAIEQ